MVVLSEQQRETGEICWASLTLIHMSSILVHLKNILAEALGLSPESRLVRTRVVPNTACPGASRHAPSCKVGKAQDEGKPNQGFTSSCLGLRKFGCGSKNRSQNGTLSGNMDQHLRNQNLLFHFEPHPFGCGSKNGTKLVPWYMEPETTTRVTPAP